MKLSDLQASRSGHGEALSKSVYDRETDNESFVSQLSATNSEIESTKYDIEQLMTKAHAFCKNSGLGSDYTRLAMTPPRFGDNASISQAKLGTRAQGQFFQSTPTRKLPQ
jgi:hypothetical protein